MRVQVYLACQILDYFNPDWREPSFSVEVPSTTDGLALNTELQKKVKWLKGYWCCYWCSFPDGPGWTPLTAMEPLSPFGTLCIRAVYHAKQVASRLGLLYIGEDINCEDAPTASVPISLACSSASLREELPRVMPDIQNYSCEFFCKREGSNKLMAIGESSVLPAVIYIKAVPRNLQRISNEEVPVQEPGSTVSGVKATIADLNRYWEHHTGRGPLNPLSQPLLPQPT